MGASAMAVLVALVVQSQTPLRASAHDGAPRQATLAAGDWLEVRGERQGYLQVYDHRRERPGYVRESAVHAYPVEEGVAPKLSAVVDYLKDVPGQESLGIGYAALYLRAAPSQDIGVDVFDAIGTMAERLAARASARVAKGSDAALASELESAESYGVKFARFDRDGQTRVCYEGEAWRRALALGATGRARVRAVLGLSDPICVDPSTGPSAWLTVVKWQAEVLDKAEPEATAPAIPAYERARLRLRRATVQANLAHLAARAGDFALAKQAGEAAKRELFRTDRAAIADGDRLAYDEAALHVASTRWAQEPAPAAPSGALSVAVTAGGEPGQTCVRVTDRAAPKAPAFEHCSYAVVWPSSVRVAPHDAAVAMVVSPLVGWNELLVLHRAQTPAGWTADTVTPAVIDPELGYVELAGFSPDGSRVLVVREARASGPLGAPNTLAPWVQKSFEVLVTSDMRAEKKAPNLANFPAFRSWQTADWRRGTIALR